MRDSAFVIEATLAIGAAGLPKQVFQPRSYGMLCFRVTSVGFSNNWGYDDGMGS